MLSTLKSVLHGIFAKNILSASKQSIQAVPYNPANLVVDSSAPIYPPATRGIEMASIESILQTQANLIDRIKSTSGITPTEFNERYLPVIRNLAGYVHLLPATRTGHHRGAGGLYRMMLEQALYSLQAAKSTVFIDKGAVSAERRYQSHPRWVYATFLAASCSELYRPMTNLIVTDKYGEKWPQLLMPLYDWATERKAGSYHVVWNQQDELEAITMNQAASSYMMRSVVPTTGFQYLNEGNTEIVTAMTSAINSYSAQDKSNQIFKIINSVRKKIIERDLASNSQMYGDFTVGAHLEPHLVDAMRKLIRKKTWELNTKGARIWNSDEGMFIVWQTAAREIIGLLKDDELPGIPSEPDTLADILINSGIAEQSESGGRYWEICIPLTMQMFPALKLKRIELLFAESELQIIDTNLLPNNVFNKKKSGPDICSPTEHKALETIQAHVCQGNEGREPELIDDLSKVKSILKEKIKQQTIVTTVDELKIPSQAQLKLVPKKSQESMVEKSQDVQKVLLSSLPGQVSDLLKAIIEDYADGSSNGLVFQEASGVAISTEEFEAHGILDISGIVKVLADKQWLYVDPEKPLKKLFSLDHKEKKVRVIILKNAIATGLGLIRG